MTNTFYVQNEQQAQLFRILQGQLSDGYWENESTDHRLWDCNVLVSTNGFFGVNFSKPVKQYKVDFEDMADGDFMQNHLMEEMHEKFPSYSLEYLYEDLKFFNTILFEEF